MLCKHCGYEMKEGAAFCQKCGVKVAEQLEQETVELTNAPVAEPVCEEPTVETPQPKKSRKRGWCIAAIVAGVLAVLVVAGIFLGPHLFPETYQSAKGLAIKTFGSSDDYLQFVEQKSTAKVVDGIVSAYGKYLESLDDPQETTSGMELSVEMKLGETVSALMKESAKTENGETIDLSWLENVAFNLEAYEKGSAAKILLALSLNGQQIISGDLIADQESVYLAILPLSDKYLKGTLAADADAEKILTALQDPKVKNALPSVETIKTLGDKYAKLFYESLKNAEKTTETITIGQVQQKVTVLKVQMDFDTIKHLSKTLLETLEKDETVKQIIDKLAAFMEEEGYIQDADQLYKDFQAGIKDTKAELNELKADDHFDKLTLNYYVNDNHEIIGMKYKLDTDASYYIAIRNGDQFAYKLDAEDLVIVGTGTKTDDVINAEYTVEMEGKEVCTVSVKDLSQKDGKLGGKIVVTPSAKFLKRMGLDPASTSVAALLNPALELVFTGEADAPKMEINLVSGENLLVGITITAKTKTATDITVPTPDQEINAEQWLASWDLNRLYDKLVAAGVPQAWAQSFIQELQQGLYPGSNAI